ncbi:MAG: hypothetical protein LBF75_05275 [Treponema sp.]|nr:hypothetical protein [Treponema sp.]
MSPVKTTREKRARPARRTARKVTLDDVWATIDEIGQAHKETEAALKETQATVREIGQAHEKTEAALKEAQRIVGDLGNKFGDEAEHTLVPGLPEKFRPFGFNFGVLNRNRKIKDDEHSIHAEIDAFLENGTQTMAVEVKVKLQMADVDTHIKRMEKLRRYADLHGDRWEFFGALAVMVVSD